MDFQGVSNAAAARAGGNRIGLVLIRAVQITPVGLLCRGIKITRCLITPTARVRVVIVKIDIADIYRER